METDPFRIRGHVANFDAIVEEIVERSAATRDKLPMIADVPYGKGESETLDLFFPAGSPENLPVHMFIHGGYWRMFSKRDYSYVADTITKAGAIAVIVDYALMPRARMAVLVDQARRAKQWVLERITEYGGAPSLLTISGHSAGAHLASFLFHREQANSNVNGAFLLGGLYDLSPLQGSFLQKEIALTREEVVDFTPLNHQHDESCRAILAVGSNETPPFHAQLNAFAASLRQQGLPVSSKIIPGRNHMDSVRDLGIPGTDAGNILTRLIQSSS
ncbi:arylformamidase [Neorhizobium galegae]|uniref:alpha/beta hydrolase n=1 Tax=Neorhizobium galegae TaxID=399 RepID=UPI002786FF67|nr:alpha/beta hydrolase [Neorhizobium galegae]MDQ0134657.1 arylformamidase [Neorhizobium galegae]